MAHSTMTWIPTRGAAATSAAGTGTEASPPAATTYGSPRSSPLLPGVTSLTLRCLELVLTPQELDDVQGVRAPPLPLSLVLPGLQELNLLPQFEPRPGADVNRIAGEGGRVGSQGVKGYKRIAGDGPRVY